MTQAIIPVLALLLGVGILFTGNGLLNSLVPLKAEMAGFDPTLIGFLGSSYFGGFLVGCLQAPGIVRRTGHIRAFAAFASLGTMAAILHGLFEEPLLWVVMRFVVGFVAASLYMIIESWLSARSENENRGTIMGVYAFVNFGALALGQQLLPFAQTDGGVLFFVVAFVTSAAILPIVLTRHDAPTLPPAAKLPFKRMLALSPVGVVGCFLNGLSNGPFWAMGTSYAQKIELSLEQTALFMTVPIIAGALSAWPVGLFSDRVDRRLVIATLWSVVGMMGCLLIVLKPHGTPLLLIMMIFGAAVMPINSIYIAHVNDCIENGDRIAISSGLILLYGTGATLGPPIAGALIGLMGASGLFVHIALVAVTGSAYTLYRTRRRARPSADQREPFQFVPRTTQSVTELDPRTGIEQTRHEIDPLPEDRGEADSN